MQRVLIIYIVFALSICLASDRLAQAQIKEVEQPHVVGAANNETTKSSLDLLAQSAGKGKLIIMIGRLGRVEKSSALNSKRLRTAREYLEKTRGLPTARVVIAEGEKVTGEGRIEVYMDNRLFMVFLFERNKNFAPEP